MSAAAPVPRGRCDPPRLQWSVAPSAASHSAPGSLPRTCVPRGANDNGCGPISQPTWNGTPRPGSGRRMAALPAGAGMWGVPGSCASTGVSGDSRRGSGTLNLVSRSPAQKLSCLAPSRDGLGYRPRCGLGPLGAQLPAVQREECEEPEAVCGQ